MLWTYAINTYVSITITSFVYLELASNINKEPACSQSKLSTQSIRNTSYQNDSSLNTGIMKQLLLIVK